MTNDVVEPDGRNFEGEGPLKAEVISEAGGNILTIRVTPRNAGVPLATLLRALYDSLKILREMDHATSGSHKATVDWDVVSASDNSPLTFELVARQRPDAPVPGRILEAYLGGLSELELGRESPAFSERALEDAKDLARSISRDGIASVEFSSPGLPTVTPTEKLAENVESIIKRRYYHEDAWLEGKLETFSIHGEPHFIIYDVLTDRPTRCLFREELSGPALASIGRRIAVDGTVRYNRDGAPVSMIVSEIRQLGLAKDLPQFSEGEQIDMTGGIESAEYVRTMRNVE